MVFDRQGLHCSKLCASNRCGTGCCLNWMYTDLEKDRPLIHNLSTAYSMSSTHNAEQTLATEEIDVPQRYIWHNGSSKPKHNGASNHVQLSPDLLKILY